MPRKIATTVYIEQLQAEQLALLSATTNRPVAELIREAVDAVLQKHNREGFVSVVRFQVELEFE